MIFKQYQQVLNGTKTQTRRPVKPSEILRYASSNGRFSYLQDEEFSIATVIMWAGDYIRIKWQVGKTYAVQPGRGKKSIGRTPPIKAIRRERLWEISREDAFAEGVHSSEGAWAIDRFGELWDRIYHLKGYRYQGLRWRDNPEVWVLEFERV